MKLFQFCHFDLVLETRHRLNRHICHLHCLSSWAHLKRKNGTELALNLEGASDKLTSAPYQARFQSIFVRETSLKYWEAIRNVAWDCGKKLLAFHWCNATKTS